jgi:hypothetical protein
MRCARFVWVVFIPFILAAHAMSARAEDISGTIAVTKVIVEDSQLVGNVTCTMTTTPCIQFGAPNIALRLRGFTLTGPANPDDTTTCQATSGPPPADGISNVVDDSDPAPVCRIIGVTSNEALDDSDWSLTGPLEVSLRADRGGFGTGRIYSITVTCTNRSLLSASRLVTVTVPHDQR